MSGLAANRSNTTIERIIENHHITRRTVLYASLLTMAAVIISRLAAFFTNTSYNITETTYVTIFSSASVALLLLQMKRTEIAAWFVIIGPSAGLFYGSIENAIGLSFGITGYVIVLVLAIMLLPGHQWRYVYLLDIGIIVIATVVHMNAPLLHWTRDEHLVFGLVQLCVISVAAAAVGYLYSGILGLVNELKESHTKLGQLHDELSEKTDLLEMITENVPVRISYFDNKQNLRFHNRAYREAYATEFEQTIAIGGNMARVIDYYQPKKRAAIDPFLQAVAKGETATFDIEELDANGKNQIIQIVYVPHLEDENVVGRVALGINITELRDMQQSLQQNLEMFDLVINNVPARIAYIDRANRLVFVNNRVEDHFGLRAEDVVGLEVDKFLPKEYIDYVAPYAQQAYETKQQLVFEAPFKMHDGAEIIERSYYYPHIINGQVEALFTLHMDVTDIKRTEASLGKAQKLESLGVLAGGIAHDFNNLLVAMLGQNSLALAKTEADHPARRHIQQSVAAAERAATLTQQMLAYSGRGAFKIGPINLNTLIENNLKLFAVSIPKNVQLVTNLTINLPEIEADTAQMQQLIMNLIINAGQAIGDKNGRISISTTVETLTNDREEFWEVTGDALVPGRYVSVQVQDDGIGMDTATKSKIFDPFYTTKENGTGLGLAAALGIIRGHQGGIRLYSEVGYGTVFHLLFPVVESRTVEYVVEPTIAAEPLQDHTILVIDDEIDIVNTVADMLELKDIVTIQATRGKHALQIYRQRQDEISLVLLDLMMPGMNGEEVFRHLRQINPDVKVVLSSGYSEAEATRHFIGQGLADFIQKPYDFQTLVAKVLGALEPQAV